MKNLKRLFILFLAFGVFAVGTVRAEELVTEEVMVEETTPGIVVNDEGETVVENNEVVDSDGEALVEGDSYTVDADSLLDMAIENLPEGTEIADEEETYRDAEMVLEDELEEEKEEKEANIVAILIVVVLIAAAVVAGIVLLGKKSKTVEIKKEEK